VEVAAALHLRVGSVRARGLFGTVDRLRRAPALRRARRRQAEADREFDREHGVDTAGWVRPQLLDTESGNLRFAVRYQPSSAEEFALLVGKLGVEPGRFTFVDYGSGKGRVLLLAARHGFRRVVGIEFAQSLVETAARNLREVGLEERVELLHLDAAQFDPPAEPLVLYFFNPFGVEVLRPVLERIRRSLAEAPRPVYVALTGPPPLAELLEEHGFQPLDVERTGWRTRGVWRAA
jgi:precorrin-6B methylase 2